MGKSLFTLVLVGVLFAGTLFAPQYAAADHDADFEDLASIVGILFNGIEDGFATLTTLIADIQVDVDANTQKSSDNMMDITDNANAITAIGPHTVDTNAGTICATGELLDGDGACIPIPAGGADDLGNHMATQDLDLKDFDINNSVDVNARQFIDRDNILPLGTDASAVGGTGNTASGDQSTVSGGDSNNAVGEKSTIGGGFQNGATGLESTIGGGFQNGATGLRSTIGGGSLNSVSGEGNTVAGGVSNRAVGDFSTIGGGFDQAIQAPHRYRH